MVNLLILLSLTFLSYAYNQTLFIFNQTLDHFHVPYQDAGTFPQRYWIVDNYFNPSYGLVFLYLCGEYECPGVDPTRLFPLQVAKDNKARFVVLEHRYYGESLPYNYSGMLPQLLTYLNAEQALADIAQFIRFLNGEMALTNPGVSFKWVVVGGSYAGGLSGWVKTRYPDLVAVSWASSAVVRPILNFTDFDKQVYLSALKSGQSCVNAIRAVNSLVETQYLANNLGPVTDIFNATAAFQGTPDKRPVLFYITDIMAELIQYGHRTELCDALIAVDNAWDMLKEVAILGDEYGMADPTGYAVNSLGSFVWTPSTAGRQWWWQQCTQFGWMQTPSEYQMRSKYLNLTFWDWYCNAIYNYPGGLPLPDVDIAGYDLNYLGTNILYTNGDEDPWQWAGINVTSTDARPVLLIKCENCGHCVELYTPAPTDPIELTRARINIRSLISKLLRNN
ncbi:unnamed protein product [Blepharisma stoltei]|uniref:Uncharacterized protein n=1 Tax=Blepharisma stoltei TaxID=1481888 RepID=A0AAU9IQV0_9CILI|nr:unnamed protein product [Blepharisma stoltei]